MSFNITGYWTLEPEQIAKTELPQGERGENVSQLHETNQVGGSIPHRFQ